MIYLLPKHALFELKIFDKMIGSTLQYILFVNQLDIIFTSP